MSTPNDLIFFFIQNKCLAETFQINWKNMNYRKALKTLKMTNSNEHSKTQWHGVKKLVFSDGLVGVPQLTSLLTNDSHSASKSSSWNGSTENKLLYNSPEVPVIFSRRRCWTSTSISVNRHSLGKPDSFLFALKFAESNGLLNPLKQVDDTSSSLASPNNSRNFCLRFLRRAEAFALPALTAVLRYTLTNFDDKSWRFESSDVPPLLKGQKGAAAVTVSSASEDTPVRNAGK